MSRSCAIVIPARMASTRFPGKPLVDLCGKPMLQWVVEAARKADLTDEIVVATPDDEILDACARLDIAAVRTALSHPSGTDRLAEVSDHLFADVYVNVQGDEPLIDPETIRACAQPLLEDPTLEMGSIFSAITDEEIDNPAVVKVVTDVQGNALYFSRHAIPFPRNPRVSPVKKHVGIYCYRRDVLQRFASWEQTPLEATESLEQLRFLEHGVRIRMSEGKASAVAVDTPEQADEVRKLLSGAGL